MGERNIAFPLLCELSSDDDCLRIDERLQAILGLRAVDKGTSSARKSSGVGDIIDLREVSVECECRRLGKGKRERGKVEKGKVKKEMGEWENGRKEERGLTCNLD